MNPLMVIGGLALAAIGLVMPDEKKDAAPAALPPANPPVPEPVPEPVLDDSATE